MSALLGHSERHVSRIRNFPMRNFRQQGVAIVTALLLTALCLTVVANLFWQQQIQVRSIENQRQQLQKRWVLRSTIDWARLVIREDAKYSRTDTLDEPWAVPLTANRLDQYVENGKDDADVSAATLSGVIIDAQSYFNLTNLVMGGVINLQEVESFARLLTNLQINPSLARATALAFAASRGKAASGVASDGTPSPLLFTHVEDLLSIPGYTPEIIGKLSEFIVILPRSTPVNANTASAEVLSARIRSLSISDANQLIISRNASGFRDLADLSQRLSGRVDKLSEKELSVTTTFFLVNGKVHMNRAELEIQALVERTGATTSLVWVREH